MNSGMLEDSPEKKLLAGKEDRQLTRGTLYPRRQQGRPEDGPAMLCRQRDGGCKHCDGTVVSSEKSRRPPELEKKADRDFVRRYEATKRKKRGGETGWWILAMLRGQMASHGRWSHHRKGRTPTPKKMTNAGEERNEINRHKTSM